MKFPIPNYPRIEMNITELCNLRCDFCPRAHGYPNRNLHMSNEILDLFLEGQEEFLARHDHLIPILLIGRGEPTLHENFIDFCMRIYDHLQKLKEKYPALKHRNPKISMIHTNGYKWEKWLPELHDKFEQIDFNCYPERTYIEYLKIKETLSIYPNVSVQDRGTTGNNEVFLETRTNKSGTTTPVKYNNRAGSIPQDIIPMVNLSEAQGRSCGKVFDLIYLDYDGEWRLCCNDWDDLVSLGNIKEYSVFEHFWHNPIYNEYRWRLANGDRSLVPCNKCNASLRDESGWKKTFQPYVDANPRWIRSVKHVKLNNRMF